MVVTLKKIWEYPASGLRPVLLSKGRDLTDNIQLDRAVVATIYFNSNTLALVDRQWVAHPQFAAVAKQTTGLGQLVQTLKRPFTNKLISAYLALFGIEDIAHSVLEGYRFQNRLDIAAFEIAYLNISHAWLISEGEHHRRTFLKLIWTAVGDSTPYQPDKIYNLVNGAKQNHPDDYETTNTAFSTEITKILEEAKTPIFIPSLKDAFVTAAVETATHTQVIRGDQLEPGAATLPISSQLFDYIDIMTTLLGADITNMERIFRCYFLYWMWDLLSEVPPIPQRDVLVAKLDAIIKQYGYQEIFADTYLTIPSGLSPVFGAGTDPTKTGLSKLIGEFVGRPPTRAEVLARIAAM